MASVYRFEKDDKLVYYAHKTKALAFARSYSSQVEHVIVVEEIEILQKTPVKLAAAILNDEGWQGASKRLAAFRRGLELKAWAE